MAKEISIAGKKINKWWLVGGAAGVVAVFYLYKRSSLGSGSSSSDSSAIDPVTGMPYSQDNQVDPATGLTYLAEAQQYGSVTAAEQEISSGSAYYGDTGAGAGLDSGYPTYYPDQSGNPPAGTTYATNAQWAQAVTSGLVALGYSSTDVAAALGLYFQEQPLGAGSDGVSYVSIIQAAVAEYGPPPVGTYPIKSAGSGGGGSTKVKVPNVTGQNLDQADSTLKAAGLAYNTSPSPEKKGYTRLVTASEPKAGTSVAKGTHIGLTWHYVKNAGSK